MTLSGAIGLGFERVIVRPVYGQHLKQILVTIGGAIVGEELIKVVWGPAQIALPPPEALRGSILIGEATVERLRLVSVGDRAGRARAAALDAQPHQDRPADPRRRAGPRDGREPRLPRSAASSSACSPRARRWPASAACLWGMNQQIVTPQIGAQVNVLLFIVIIIGGLGSTVGCLVGALLVGLMTNYVGFIAPKAAMFSSIGLMVAVLLWRPQGLYPVVDR